MRVAMPICEKRLSPVFDVANHLLLFDVEGREKNRCEQLCLEQTDGVERAELMSRWAVEVLICGAISREMERLLESRGIKVKARICGNVEEVLKAFIDGLLDSPEYAMPGCRFSKLVDQGSQKHSIARHDEET